jgi:hypothetical protein
MIQSAAAKTVPSNFAWGSFLCGHPPFGASLVVSKVDRLTRSVAFLSWLLEGRAGSFAACQAS